MRNWDLKQSQGSAQIRPSRKTKRRKTPYRKHAKTHDFGGFNKIDRPVNWHKLSFEFTRALGIILLHIFTDCSGGTAALRIQRMRGCIFCRDAPQIVLSTLSSLVVALIPHAPAN
jgi:hypothetical protein